MEAGSKALQQRYLNIKTSVAKYIVSWVGEVVAYWIFVGLAIRSVYGFNWWVVDTEGKFGIICIVYAVKNFLLLVLTPFQHRRNKQYSDHVGTLNAEPAQTTGNPRVKFPYFDILYYITQTAFWVISAVYAFDRRITAEKMADAEWRIRYQRWTDYAFIIPVVKLGLDVIYCALAAFLTPISHCSLSGGPIIWMDFQYLFVYLWITGKVNWGNYYIVFVWIYMASILAVAGALCLVGGLITYMVKRRGNIFQYFLMALLPAMVIIFFVWENLVGSKRYEHSYIYLLLAAVALYTVINIVNTAAIIRGIELIPETPYVKS
jgi:hypothetical protein